MDSECADTPHVKRIVFDIGDNKTSAWRLCEKCSNYSVSKKYVLNIQEIKKEFADTFDGTAATLETNPKQRSQYV